MTPADTMRAAVEALEEIAKPCYGLELGDSDDVRADYWAKATERCRSRDRFRPLPPSIST
jgi:hypothetical protein